MLFVLGSKYIDAIVKLQLKLPTKNRFRGYACAKNHAKLHKPPVAI